MHVVHIASEATPYARTGGLGDMVASLARDLASRGHRIDVYLPHYRPVQEFETVVDGEPYSVRVGTETCPVRTRRIEAGKDEPEFRFIEHVTFEREGIYGPSHGSYPDNAARFTLFQRAVLADLARRGVTPDLLHAHDWQAALVPIFAKKSEPRRPTLLTIHNLAHQGRFGSSELALTGLGEDHFHPGDLEFHGDMNWLKGGIVNADRISTVSPTYAGEIQSEEFGCGLEGVLQHRSAALSGIVNGIDTTIWNPADDPLIPHAFTAADLSGKAACKRALQERVGLAVNDDAALFGVVARLASQKGIDLLLESTGEWLAHGPAQMVVLGVGDPNLERSLSGLAAHAPDRVAALLRFDDELAHWIEAGSDFFLMPSRYEPCGLNQLYSQRYGTLPIVRNTGGLVDTVIPINWPTPGSPDTATGFAFGDLTTGALAGTIREALRIYEHERETFDQMRQNAMAQDFSWSRSADRYEELYTDAIERFRSEGVA